MSEVERLCDSIIMMKNGDIIDKGTCNELIKKHGRNNLEETFLKLARGQNGSSKVYVSGLRHLYLTMNSFPRILDLIYWPTVQIFLWGFISKFFTINSEYYSNTVGVILTAAILYDFLFRASISFNMMFLEEIWSRNFTNLFIAPVRIRKLLQLYFNSNSQNFNRISPSGFDCNSSFWSFSA